MSAAAIYGEASPSVAAHRATRDNRRGMIVVVVDVGVGGGGVGEGRNFDMSNNNSNAVAYRDRRTRLPKQTVFVLGLD